MSRPILDIETMLRQLINEHQKLLLHVDTHQAAMRKFDLAAMDASAKQQEAARLRIAGLEMRRRTAVVQVAKLARIQGEPNVEKLAELFPDRAIALRALRTELKQIVGQILARTNVASRLAGSLLGHLNTAVRLLAGAVERAGVYTKDGVPRVSNRIGAMEAVG